MPYGRIDRDRRSYDPVMLLVTERQHSLWQQAADHRTRRLARCARTSGRGGALSTTAVAEAGR
jgi:hypothetical protein